jgi:imidazolonepropionase-like amidohydrolase
MKLIFTLFLTVSLACFGQINHPQNGVKPTKQETYAFKNATIVVGPNNTIDKGTILVKNDEILEVGRFVAIPKGTVIIDCSGKTIMASFIELNAQLGLPEPSSKPFNFRPQLESSKKGAYYWNESIHPEVNSAEHYTIDEKAITELQKMGFGLALTHVNDGIAQGSGALVNLSNNQYNSIVEGQAGAFFSFDKGVSRQTYPSSQMGSIALLRQTLYDLDWYKKNSKAPRDLSLEALKSQMEKPLFFSVEEKWETMRAFKIANEFNLNFIYIGAGDEYAIKDELNKNKISIVVPLYFPEAYDVNDPYVNRQIPLSQLKHWELAPQNPKILKEANVPFCLSSNGNKSAGDFWKNVQRMIEAGMNPEDALAALTTLPSTWLKISNQYGTLEKGKKAHFTIYNGHPFKEKAQILESWMDGEQTIHNTLPEVDIRGNYNLLIDGKSFPIQIEGSAEKPTAEIQYNTATDTVKITPFIEVISNDVVIQFNVNNTEWSGSVNLKGKFNQKMGIFEGSGQIPTGKWIVWSGIRNTKFKEDKKDDSFKVKNQTTPEMWYPNMAYGSNELPKNETIVIKNATLWTGEAEGKIENATIVINNGKITGVGKNITADASARIIDGTGKHVTAGIIDEHSHIAISKGVNEGGQSISAEVSIADVVDPDDINIYRQLSGGVTAAQLLHGSANPIGGQSALIKLKWGYSPEGMVIPNSPKFIKCALGENVKQANWGDFNTARFPQTRMGVEQVFYDAFNRAKVYEKEKKSGNYRTDLELETLLEILKGERHITCHSYIQSEINMLMHMADSMGFKINTFTHILEGYKVADKMAAHGAGGSTFADWWAYKYEVKDAIPYNAQIMHEQGVVVAINSDDAEMGRRLNQEAAKAVKYGGMSEIDALNMVTINPAKLLHLDDRMGSLKVGKDGDVVVWSDHPLSAQAKAEYTIVDGVILFDRKKDEELQKRNNAERARILAEMLEANKKGEKKVSFFKRKKGLFHCDTMGEEASEKENTH